MKKKFILIIFALSILGISVVKAESFVEGSYISGEYISKKKDGAIHYMTLQYLKDSNGNIVYCLEPFTKFVEGKSYTTYAGDLSSYKDLSTAIKRKISLIVYYGYGYTDRKTSKWYAITQFLIWDTISNSDGSIYFTDSLNGKKISKYTTEINEIKNDITNHETKPAFVKDYVVDYGKDLTISSLDSNKYSITTNYKYNTGTSVVIKNIVNDGSVKVSKMSNFYKNKVAIFDSNQSQDLIRPGNVDNPSYTMNVKVKKGNISLDIKDDDSVYTIEKDFSNTCYEIIKDEEVKDRVCTGNDEMIYETVDLPYGDYEIKQVSNGIGYKKDEEIYKVSINDSNNKPYVTLYNYLIKNRIGIKKYYCKDQVCKPESAAKFNVFDSKNNLIESLITNQDGNAAIILGYGSYKINQVSGLYDYTMADPYTERIVDETTNHDKELFNYYIEKTEVSNTPEEIPKNPVKEEPKKEEVKEKKISEEVEEEVPDTKVDGNWFERILYAIIEFFTSLLDNIVE